jgi:hypothetical protein
MKNNNVASQLNVTNHSASYSVLVIDSDSMGRRMVWLCRALGEDDDCMWAPLKVTAKPGSTDPIERVANSLAVDGFIVDRVKKLDNRSASVFTHKGNQLNGEISRTDYDSYLVKATSMIHNKEFKAQDQFNWRPFTLEDLSDTFLASADLELLQRELA